ncbi:hypothetical protein BH09BAC2_BH09BAC2_22830 [soil metagenome]
MEYLLHKNIISNPDICNGKPVIKGTRITFQTNMGFVIAGDSGEEVLGGYPRITSEDIKTCKEFTVLLFEKPTLLQHLKASV